MAYAYTPITRRGILLDAASLLLGHRLLRAQEAQQAPATTFAADVNVVNVFATVRDKKGNIVKDLTKDDFILTEEGRPQPLRYFARESDLPLTIGLIVDTTASESNMLEEEKRASRTFLNKMLRPEKDKAFLIQFGNEIELLQDVTSSREKLEKALDLLERHSMSGGQRRSGGAGRTGGSGRTGGPGGPGGPGQGGGRGGANSTVLADSIFLASDEILSAHQGRKALIVMGDGDHVGERLEKAITAAHRADTLVYCIRIWDKNFGGGGGGMRTVSRIPGIGLPGGGGAGGGGRGGPGGGGPGGGGPGGGPGGPDGGRSNGKKDLQAIASRTGGAYFEVTKKETLEQIYAKIEEDLRHQYSLGYTPESAAAGGYRRIKVDVQKKGLTVRSREGYYPDARTEPKTERKAG